jgi:hypothetical protein
MRRRRFIAAAAACGIPLAGCLGGDPSVANGGTATSPGVTGATDSATPGTTRGGGGASGPAARTAPNLADVDLPLPRSALTFATGKDIIPAITDPAFGEDWSGVSIPDHAGEAGAPRLEPSDEVIGVVREGDARAYPLLVLNEHEIVNDSFHGPLLVSYCPLCGSSVTAVRRVRGEPTTFGVSGKLWRSDLVMYDERTESYWSQILATAVRGPATGDRLELVPSTVTTWGAWRTEYPDTRVLRPPPESSTVDDRGAGSYIGDPREAYEESRLIGVTGEKDTDGRLHPKTRVLGVTDGTVARAYPEPAVRAAGGVVNDAVGDRPVVVALGPGETLVGYDRRLGRESDDGTAGDGTTPLTFTRADARHIQGGNSRWRLLSGNAVDGPHQGTELRPASDRPPMFWFAWRDFHPGTDLYQA